MRRVLKFRLGTYVPPPLQRASGNLIATYNCTGGDACLPIDRESQCSGCVVFLVRLTDGGCSTVYTCFVFTSGDGTLSVFNVRRQKIEEKSDNMESELLSVAVVKVSVTQEMCFKVQGGHTFITIINYVMCNFH